MIVVMKMHASEAEIEGVLARIRELGFAPHLSRGEERTIIGVVGDDSRAADAGMFGALPGVADCIRVLKPFKLASRDFLPRSTVVEVGEAGNAVEVGGPRIVIAAGPCAVESWEQIEEVAVAAKSCGVRLLRGGAFKPRTSPYSFQGLGEEGLKLLARVRETTGLPGGHRGHDARGGAAGGASTPTASRSAPATCRTSTCCRPCGKAKKPVLLKRGMAATIEEFLMAAEYILASGNRNVILCERGSAHLREGHAQHARPLGGAAFSSSGRHLPVIVDPSHGTGICLARPAHGARRDRVRRRRPAHRGPSAPRARSLRWAAVAHAQAPRRDPCRRGRRRRRGRANVLSPRTLGPHDS